MAEPKQLTVSELAYRLNQIVKDGHGQALVVLEGCDCDGPCTGVDLSGPPYGVLFLERG